MRVFVTILLGLIAITLPLSTSAADLEDEIRQADRAWAAAYNSKDDVALGNFYTDNAIRLHPDAPLRTTGRSSIVASFKTEFANGARNYRNTIVDVGGDGNSAWLVGDWSVNYPDSDQKMVTYTGNYLVIYERTPSGPWLIRYETWNNTAK